MQIKNRVFIVTGAPSGIGLSMAAAPSARGAKVALLACGDDALQGLSQRLLGSSPHGYNGVKPVTRRHYRA